MIPFDVIKMFLLS